MKVTYISHDGEKFVVDTDAGTTVMNAALDNLVPGIDADCGGECSCATCHVFVDAEWVNAVGVAGDTEESMLDLNPEREANSRLSCQIQLVDQLDGLVVHLPEFQF